MKKLLVFTFALVLFSTVAFTSFNDFCDGYRIGYKNGWCFKDVYCIPPIPPICPISNIGEDTYQEGYDRGFIDGYYAKNQKL